MAEQNENSEKPTEKRLQEALERGEFARAPEVGLVTGLFASYFVLLIMGKQQAIQVAEFSISVFGHLDKIDLQAQSVPEWTRLGVMMMLGLGMPIMATCAIAGILAGAGQSGFALTTEVLTVKLERLDPIAGFQRVFSKAGLMRMLVDFIKFVVVGVLIYGGVRQILGDPIFYTPVPVARLGDFLYESSLRLLVRLALAMTGVALLHYLYQRFKTEKEMMMSHHEVKEEMREAGGDPLVKMAQRAMARRLMQKQMLEAVPTADVIITNPTHYAVALKYERGKDSAPIILAKGENLLAKRIKALGSRFEVPTVENKPVARALFKYGKVGERIPSQLYHAIAEILGYVYKTHRYYFHQLKMRRNSA